MEGIKRLESFFKSIGLPTTLGELGITEDRLLEMAESVLNQAPPQLVILSSLERVMFLPF